MATTSTISRFHRLIEREVCTINGTLGYPRVINALQSLAYAIHRNNTHNESIWWIGEDSYTCLADMVTGAYWHLEQWHDGQMSDSYIAFCMLSDIFQPNMAAGPEDGSGDQEFYELLHDMATKHYEEK